MAERPILFSAPMVRALLAGRKKQTRRLAVMPPGWPRSAVETRRGPGPQFYPYAADGFRLGHAGLPAKQCRFGVPGDRLWIREACMLGNDDCPLHRQGVVGATCWCDDPKRVIYRADPPVPDRMTEEFGWRPAIHMPRWASRIMLEVTDVRLQLLQHISEPDAWDEGIRVERNGMHWRGQATLDGFRELWDSINGARAAWDSNPWVWAVSFKVTEKP